MSDTGGTGTGRDRAPRRLEHAPGDRFRGPAPGGDPAPAGRPRPRYLAVAGTAVAGAAVFGIAGSFDLGVGLVALAAFIGWAVAIALVWGGAAGRPGAPARSAALASAIGVASVVGGLVLLWAWARAEGGVLTPIEYVDERFGWLGVVFLLAAALAAYLRAR